MCRLLAAGHAAYWGNSFAMALEPDEYGWLTFLFFTLYGLFFGCGFWLIAWAVGHTTALRRIVRAIGLFMLILPAELFWEMFRGSALKLLQRQDVNIANFAISGCVWLGVVIAFIYASQSEFKNVRDSLKRRSGCR